MEYSAFRAMNTDILLGAEGDHQAVASGFQQAQALIERAEARMTRFSTHSELTKLNQSDGEWFQASAELFDVVRQARELFYETDGLFDPSILSALEIAGYDKSMDEIRANGATQTPARAQAPRSDFGAVQLDESARAIRLVPGMRIDLGGIAKGWIAEQAAHALASLSPACVVNAGGDMYAIGVPSDEGRWRVALEDPRDEKETLAILSVGPGAVATSTIMRRRWMQGDRVRHHLIDPRTGIPAETDWLSVTVMAPHATTAEVFAKALLIGGSREAERLAARHSDMAFVAVDRTGRLWGSENSEEYLDVAEYA